MKTNQVLTRKMGEFEVIQRTSDGMFNATALLKNWNEFSGQSKEIKKFFENNNTQDFIEALIKEENLNGENSAYLKSKGKYTGGTWMHPLLFIDFAMWINPAFKVKVLKFVYDQLLQYRNDAGDAYKDMCAAVARITDSTKMPIAVAIQNTSKAINHIVFGMHESEIRNKKAEESLLKELLELEKQVTFIINEGFVTTYDALIIHLRKQWTKKWQPKFLSAS